MSRRCDASTPAGSGGCRRGAQETAIGAKMGDLWGLKTQAEQLLEGDQTYQAFVNQVLELVQGFEEKELSKLFGLPANIQLRPSRYLIFVNEGADIDIAGLLDRCGEVFDLILFIPFDKAKNLVDENIVWLIVRDQI